jgi:hypothetical protein
MWILLSEGLSWPGGYSNGRFDFLRSPATPEAVLECLEQSLRSDAAERKLLEYWESGHTTPPPPTEGIRYDLVECGPRAVAPDRIAGIAKRLGRAEIAPVVGGEIKETEDTAAVATSLWTYMLTSSEQTNPRSVRSDFYESEGPIRAPSIRP